MSDASAAVARFTTLNPWSWRVSDVRVASGQPGRNRMFTPFRGRRTGTMSSVSAVTVPTLVD